MENNFEERRSGAHCVGQVDMCCLVCQTLMIVAMFVMGLAIFNEGYHRISDEVVVFVVLSTIIIILIVAVDFYAISRLLKASSENNNVSAEKALSWTRFWYYLSIFFLIIGIVGELIAFQPKSILALAVGVPIRLYMLSKVKKYIDVLEEQVPETVTTGEYQDDIV